MEDQSEKAVGDNALTNTHTLRGLGNTTPRSADPRICHVERLQPLVSDARDIGSCREVRQHSIGRKFGNMDKSVHSTEAINQNDSISLRFSFNYGYLTERMGRLAQR
jgi:hypothetical protein